MNEIRIDSPLGWLFGSVAKERESLIASIPMKKGDPFDEKKANDGFKKVKERLPELNVDPDFRFAFRFGRPQLTNCDSQAQTLDLVYRIYSFTPSYYLSRTFESGRKEEVSRTAIETPATKLMANYRFQPYMGYNRSRGLFGGTKLSIRRPGVILDKVEMEASGSSSSSVVKAEAIGSHDFETGFIRYTDWRLAYGYSDVPSNSVKLREGSLVGQFSAATRAFGRQEMILRFGASIEGGNKQTNLDQNETPPSTLANSGYGAMKAFIGNSMNFGEHSLKMSYGLQVGNAHEGPRADYVKQVFDAAAKFRFLPRDHRPVTIESQFTAGSIHIRGQIPVAERFFGGNVEQNFIRGDDWIIRSNPVIRSFPQNRFTPPSKEGAMIGGDRFYSANITLAATVWGYPLVPREILDDPTFEPALKDALSSTESFVSNRYLADTDEFRQIAVFVHNLSPVVAQLKIELKKVLASNPNDEAKEQLRKLFKPGATPDQQPSGAFDRVELKVETIIRSLAPDSEQGPAFSDIKDLFVTDLSDPDDPLPSYLEDLNETLLKLEDSLGAPNAEPIKSLRKLMEGIAKQVEEKFLALDPPEPAGPSPQRKLADEQAKKTMEYSARVLRQLIHDANLIAISPAVIFDAARIEIRGTGDSSLRYAFGGGVRMSLVSLDLTAGYAFNIHRRQGEGRGAFLFTMNVSNLFR